MTSNQHGPLMSWATHMLQWPVQRVAKTQGGANPKKSASVQIAGATRPHEVGIASNRGSECRGEYVLESCTHRPSHQGSRECLKFLFGGTRVSSVTRVKS